MIALDVLYVALATIGIMALLQVLTFVMVRVLYPPEPKICLLYTSDAADE